MTTPLKRKAVDAAVSATKKPKANASITSFFSSPSAPAAPKNASPGAPNPTSSQTAADDASPSDSSQNKPDAKDTATTPAASIFTNADKDKGKEAAKAASASSGTKFNKAEWVKKLTPEQEELLALEIETLHESWLAQLKDEIVSKEFLDLKRFLKKEHDSGKKIFPPAPDVYSWYV